MTTITFRVEDELKYRCKSLLEEQGTTISQALKKYLALIVNEGCVRVGEIPNETTLSSISKTQAGVGVKRFKSSQDLKSHLLSL
ncbi:MAG: type II toxin-antitoxin system RelB/DinJ family antitoxin [Chitinivibrionia bacterium]|nr:type II toxin-antitoxin system RelB/DinJ family antitoxin [Chitinivibrionia bacterium]